MSTIDIPNFTKNLSARRLDQCSKPCPDLDRYRPYVAHLDMPGERKTDMMLAIWRVMQSFVDRAFGDDPVQRSGCVAGNHHAVDEVAAPPMIDCPTDAPFDETLSDAFHHYAAGANKEEKR